MSKMSCGGPAPPFLTLPSNGALLLWWSQASSHSASVMGHHSLGAPPCYFHTANPSSFPGTDFQSLNLSPTWVSQAVVCWAVALIICAALCFSFLRPVAVLFSEALRRLLHPSWFPCQSGASQGADSFPLMQILLRSVGRVLNSFFPTSLSFPFCSTQSCGRFLFFRPFWKSEIFQHSLDMSIYWWDSF